MSAALHAHLEELEAGTLLLGAEELPPLPEPIWSQHLSWAWGPKKVHSVRAAEAVLVRVGPVALNQTR